MMVLMVAATTAMAQSTTTTTTTTTSASSALDLRSGTYQIGGSATANIGLINDETDVYLLISPEGGYFLADNLQLFFSLDLLVDESQDFNVSGGVGVDWFFPGEWVAPYIGAEIGYGTRQLDDAPFTITLESQGVLTLSGRVGMVLPMSNSVGLDLGAKVNYNYSRAQQWVTIPMGVIGVRAFFR